MDPTVKNLLELAQHNYKQQKQQLAANLVEALEHIHMVAVEGVRAGQHAHLITAEHEIAAALVELCDGDSKLRTAVDAKVGSLLTE